jgi:hypothetical protein
MSELNPFLKVYEKLSDREILETIGNPRHFDPLAVEAARFEFQKRNLNDADIELIINEQAEIRRKKKLYKENIKVKTGNYFSFLQPIKEKWLKVRSEDFTAFLLILIFSIVFFVFYLVILQRNLDLVRFLFVDFNLVDFLLLNGQFILITIGFVLFVLIKKAGWLIMSLNYSVNFTISLFNLLTFILFSQSNNVNIQGVQIQNPTVFYALIVLLNAIMLFILCLSKVRRVYAARPMRAFLILLAGSALAFALWFGALGETAIYFLLALIIIYLVSFILISRNKTVLVNITSPALDHDIFETDEQEPEELIPSGSFEIDPVWIDELYSAIRNEHRRLIKSSSDRLLILEMIREKCIDTEMAYSILQKYILQYNRNLIDDLSKLSSAFAAIKENLDPFIRFGLVEPEYPHNRIES